MTKPERIPFPPPESSLHERCVPVEVADELAKALAGVMFNPNRYRTLAEAVLREYGASRGIPVGEEIAA